MSTFSRLKAIKPKHNWGSFLTGLLIALIMLFLFYCALIYRKEISAGVSFGLSYSLKTLIPSLFPMIFLSSMLAISPAAPALSRLFAPTCKAVFHLPGKAVMPIILGLCCGYPVGAKLTAILLKNKDISPSEAQRLMLFTMNPGIPFSVLFVGCGLLGSMELGFILFACTGIPSVILGIASGITPRLRHEPITASRGFGKSPPFLSCMDKAAKSSLSATCTMCLYVVIFSAFIPVLNALGLFQWCVWALQTPFFHSMDTAVLLSFFTDVIHGLEDAARLGSGIPVIALGLSFGGLCIHFQLFSFFETPPIGLRRFYIARVVHGLMSLGLALIFSRSFPQLMPKARDAMEVFSSISPVIPEPTKGTITGSLCLILLSCAFIYLNKNVEKESNLM